VVRTLPLRLAPVAGEAIDSWLEALAYRSEVTWSEFRAALGSVLPPHRRPDRWLGNLTDKQSRVISGSTGVDTPTLRAMTLEAYPAIAAGYNPLTGQPASVYPWRHVHASRFCPKCLAENGGRWRLIWRMVWFFACPIHQCLLADSCPECHAPQRNHIPATLVPRPGLCRAPTGEQDPRLRTSRCAADLTRAEVHHLDIGHPALSAQRTISDAILLNRTNFGIYSQLSTALPEILADFRAVGSWLQSKSGRTALDALVPSDLMREYVALPDPNPRSNAAGWDRASPAAGTAAALTAAMAILGLPEIEEAAVALDTVWPRTNRLALNGRVYDRQRTGANTSLALQAVAISARDHQMRATGQLRHRSGTALPRRPGRDLSAAQATAAHIPSVFWPALAMRFTGSTPFLRAARPALSVAVLMVGNDLKVEEAMELLGCQQPTNGVVSAIRGLSESRYWPGIRLAINRVSDYLQGNGGPIDYQRRREMSLEGLLPEAEWREICRRAAVRQEGWVIARWYLAERISGKQVPLSSGPVGQAKSYPSALRFPLRLTPELSDGLMRHASEFLASRGIPDEPPQWRPPADIFEGLDLPSQGVEAVDTDKLYRLVNLRRRMKIPLREIPRQLGTNIEKLRILCEEFPAPRIPHGKTVDEVYPEISSENAS